MELGIAVRGSLHPEQTDGRNRIALRDAHGIARMWYGKLAVYDADHAQLPSSMEVRGGRIALRFDDEGARYPVVVDPIIVTARTKLVPPEPHPSGRFGRSVALWGNTLVVQAFSYEQEDRRGMLHVFVREGQSWRRQATLVPEERISGNDTFGSFPNIHDDTIVAGARRWNEFRGAVYVLVRENQTWRQQARLELADGVPDDLFGGGLALWNDTLVAGAMGRDNGAGAAYVFVREGRSWRRQAVLRPWDGASGRFGGRVALWGDMAAIGEPSDDEAAQDAGAIYVFHRDGDEWKRGTKITAPDARASDRLGFNTVSLHQQTIAANVGPRCNTGSCRMPRVHVFARRNGAWSTQATLTDPDVDTGSFGLDTAVWGDRLLVADIQNDTGIGLGHLYTRRDGSWQRELTLETFDSSTGGVSATALWQDDVAATGVGGADEGATRSGAAFVYEFGPDGGASNSDAAMPSVDAGSSSDGGGSNEGGTPNDAGVRSDGMIDSGTDDDPVQDSGTRPSEPEDAGSRTPPDTSPNDGTAATDARVGRRDAAGTAEAGPEGTLTTWGCGCRIPTRRPKAPGLAGIALAAFVIRQHRRAARRQR